MIMSSSIPYSAEPDDLFYPCKRGEFFPAGRPESEAALCAEMARLAYCKQESSFAFDQDKIRSILRGIGFNDCKCFESQTDPKGKGVHCFLASRDDKQLAIVAFHFGKPYYIDVSRKVIFDPSHFFMLEDGLHGDLAARGASLDSQRKRLRDSQRSSLQCAHGDGATRAAATTRGVLDRAHGATPDSGAPFLRTAEPAAGGAWV